jgi:type IV secretory pathway VirD2 relaxase
MKTLVVFFVVVAGLCGAFFGARSIARDNGREQGKAAAEAFRGALRGTPEEQAAEVERIEARTRELQREYEEMNR